MDLLIDTQAIVWLSTAPGRLSRAARDALANPDSGIFVSAVTAYEYADLNKRGRFLRDLPLLPVLARMRAAVVDFPAEAWRVAETLPNLHRDPVDRMLAAHAIHADITLVTADVTMRSYPVRTLW